MSSPSESHVNAVLHELARASSQRALFTQAVAAQLGLAASDLECLELLEDAGWATAGQLAEVTGLTSGAITGLIDRLEQAGYVTRGPDLADRRRVIVRPVPERLVQIHQIEAPLRQALSAWLSEMSADQLDLLRDFERRAYQITQQHTLWLREETARPGSGGREFSAPRGGVSNGMVEFANGASQLTIQAGADAGELYRAAFNRGAEPVARVQDGTVTFRYQRASLFDWGRFGGTVWLNAAIPWTIAFKGGASKVTIRARELALRGVTLGGGASTLDIVLPRPAGTAPIRIEGGASRVSLRRPAGIPAELRIAGGASRLVFDAQRFGAVGGEVRLASPGFETAADRYQIDIHGGASRLDIITYQEDET
ncbi:MAG: MarR family transcriptional regulator [Chloroflexi bacterium]|nr:MarR family transcriptional regulator [Chloroflexota bacterium]